MHFFPLYFGAYLNGVDHFLDIVRVFLDSSFHHHQTRAAVLSKLNDKLRVAPFLGELCVAQKQRVAVSMSQQRLGSSKYDTSATERIDRFWAASDIICTRAIRN